MPILGGGPLPLTRSGVCHTLDVIHRVKIADVIRDKTENVIRAFGGGNPQKNEEGSAVLR